MISLMPGIQCALLLDKSNAVKMGIEDGSPQGSQCFGADEVPTVCQNDAAVRYGT